MNNFVHLIRAMFCWETLDFGTHMDGTPPTAMAHPDEIYAPCHSLLLSLVLMLSLITLSIETKIRFLVIWVLALGNSHLSSQTLIEKL